MRLILCLIFLCACSDNSTRKNVDAYWGIQKVEYQNHSYIIWSQYNKGAMVHDPDCQCKKNEK